MSRQKRDTLKGYFAEGERPTASDFADLIDSGLNLVDDGFSRDPQYGVQIKLVGDQSRLMSFYGASQSLDTPDWSVTCNSAGTLKFMPCVGTSGAGTLTLSKDGYIGVQQDSPAFPLDVNGTLRAKGRIGLSGTVAADGNWYPITDTLTGCHAFEVVACVGLRGEQKGRYALLHAIALNTFNPTGFFRNFLGRKNRIKSTHAWYLSRADRLKLQWESVNDAQHQYRLSLKSMSSYGAKIDIQYSVTELWFDDMSEPDLAKPEGGAP